MSTLQPKLFRVYFQKSSVSPCVLKARVIAQAKTPSRNNIAVVVVFEIVAIIITIAFMS